MSLEVLAGGPMTTVQEWPGRLGMWDVGVPPSGPMDALSFRLANRLCGNSSGAAGLEVTVGGFRCRFVDPAVVVVGGADLGCTLDGAAVPLWTPVAVAAGAELGFAWARGAGMRAYVCFAGGGVDVDPVLGSRATFPLGGFGGFGGRALGVGDVVPTVSRDGRGPSSAPVLPVRPVLRRSWTLRVRRGPHDDLEWFTAGDLSAIFASSWTVGAQSDRTGVRLEGFVPAWARGDGGDAGLHPSNLHDNAYVVGSLIFTGDAPVLVGPDGPSLGGFVSPCVVVRADLWKLGQLRPGDTVRLSAVSAEEARWLDDRQERWLAPAAPSWAVGPASSAAADPPPGVVVRPTGDAALLVEFGPNTLDLRLRLQAWALEERLREAAPAGLRDMTGGIRSLQVQFDPRETTAAALTATVCALAADLDVDGLEVAGRTVWLPLSYDDPGAHEAMQRYQRLVRPDAPWCPDNIEFIRRVNGLEDRAEVRDVVFDASYLVLGLGDVYLGAPVAVPLDPRHRLVTTKYNPARTWTPENAVGIGGAYLCVYGMEGPGGYQLVGRTTQVWDPRSLGSSDGPTPWRLRVFDQLRFYPVSHEELMAMRGSYVAPRVEPASFSLSSHAAFCASHAEEIGVFRTRQQAAFAAEREAWAAAAASSAVAA